MFENLTTNKENMTTSIQAKQTDKCLLSKQWRDLQYTGEGGMKTLLGEIMGRQPFPIYAG